jgi:hypothetical protein
MAECEALRGQIAGCGGAQSEGSPLLSDDERGRMVRQISEAIRLIDKHL